MVYILLARVIAFWFAGVDVKKTALCVMPPLQLFLA